jgi:hypothetical protein
MKGEYTQEFLDECKRREADPDEVSVDMDAMEHALGEMARLHPIRCGPPFIMVNGVRYPSLDPDLSN